MPAFLKTRHGSEVYRVFIEEELGYDSVAAAIEKVRPAGCRAARLVAKYLDDEGDLCTLCPATFEDFLECSGATISSGGLDKGPPTLRLQLCEQGRLPVEAPPPLAVRPPAAPAEWPDSVQPTEGPAACSSSAGGAWSPPDAPACEQFEAGPLIFEGLKRFMEGQWKEWKAEGSRHGRVPGALPAEDGADWYLRPQKMLWILARLRSAGVLTGNMMASLVVQWLPKMLAAVSTHTAEVDECCGELLPRLRERGILRDVLACVRACPGLRACEDPLGALLAEEAASASEALLSLLTALDALPFEQRAAFVAGLFRSLEDRIGEVLDEFDSTCDPWMKGTALEHRFITCDGCGATPLRGLRFKCQVCPNYDLCGECFPQKQSKHGKDCADHDFTCVVMDWLCKFKGGSPLEQLMKAVKGKGMWQKGRGKSAWQKGCGKGKVGGSKGKGKCKGKAPGSQEEACAAGSRGGSAGGAAESDLSFPVEVEDGRRLVIRWNFEDDPEQVAAAFSLQHGFLPDEVPSIVKFVRHAAALAQAEREVDALAQAPPPAAPADKLPDEACELRAQGLAEAGLGSVDAMRDLLRNHGNDPAKVLEELAK